MVCGAGGDSGFYCVFWFVTISGVFIEDEVSGCFASSSFVDGVWVSGVVFWF